MFFCLSRKHTLLSRSRSYSPSKCANLVKSNTKRLDKIYVFVILFRLISTHSLSFTVYSVLFSFSASRRKSSLLLCHTVSALAAACLIHLLPAKD